MIPHRHEHLKQLGHVVVSGTNRWSGERVRELIPTHDGSSLRGAMLPP